MSGYLIVARWARTTARSILRYYRQLQQLGLIRWPCMKHPGRHKIKFGCYRLIEWLKRQIHPPAVRFLTA